MKTALTFWFIAYAVLSLAALSYCIPIGIGNRSFMCQDKRTIETNSKTNRLMLKASIISNYFQVFLIQVLNLKYTIILFGLIFFTCSKKTQIISSNPIETPKIIYTGPPKIQFDSTHYHIGTIKQGEIKNFELNFINAGGEALEIKLISACECTTVDWPVLPIASGVQKKLKISYNSKDKKGLQIVDLDIMTNMPEERRFIKFELYVE